jgi:hypothetical protein
MGDTYIILSESPVILLKITTQLDRGDGQQEVSQDEYSEAGSFHIQLPYGNIPDKVLPDLLTKSNRA